MTVKPGLALGAAVGVVLLAWYAKYQAGQAIDSAKASAAELWTAAKDASDYVNPTSDKNVAYQASSSLAQWLTGDTGSLGTIMFDYAHKGEPLPGGGGVYVYTPEQQAADLKATQQLQAGFHGM